MWCEMVNDEITGEPLEPTPRQKIDVLITAFTVFAMVFATIAIYQFAADGTFNEMAATSTGLSAMIALCLLGVRALGTWK